MSSISTRDIEARTANRGAQRVPPPVAVCSLRALHIFDAVMGIRATGRVRRPVAEPSKRCVVWEYLSTGETPLAATAR